MQGQLWVGPALADSGTVVLHRVSAAFSGAVDTVAVDAAGAFELRLPVHPAESGSVFFASTWYDHVLYFGGAIAGEPAPDSAYAIRAYPSVPAGSAAQPAVHVRNLILQSAGPGGGWSVTDVFEVHNDAQATIVSSEQGAAWSHPLPEGATEFRTGRDDGSALSATLARGRVEVSEAVPPGSSVFFFRYRIPSGDFDVPLEGVTGSMELLAPAGGPAAEALGLAAAGEAEFGGAAYRRFAGRGLAPGTVTVRARPSASVFSGARLVAALAAVALSVAGTVAAARRRRRAALRGAGADRRELLVAVAELDEAARAGDVGADEHRRRRRALLRRLGG